MSDAVPDQDDMYEPLRALIAGIYDRHRHNPRISPAWLATEAMHELGFARDLHPLGYAGCHAGLEMLARELLGLTEATEPANTEAEPQALRREAEALHRHADALEAFGAMRAIHCSAPGRGG